MPTLADTFQEAMRPGAQRSISVRAFTPEQIRTAIADLVSADQLPLADALGVAGLTFYPDSEALLDVCALLALVRQDWQEADHLLGRQVAANGMSAAPSTWLHWIRSIQCQLDTERALATAQLALHEHPDDNDLSEALDYLTNLVVGEQHAQVQRLPGRAPLAPVMHPDMG